MRARSRFAPWLFLAAPLLLFAAFLLYPIARSLWLSTRKTAGPGFQESIGLGNYDFLLRDGLFWTAAYNTALFALCAVVLNLALALLLALALDHPRLRGKALLRFAFFCPHLVGAVYLAVILAKMLHSSGPVNAALKVVSGKDWTPIGFLSDPAWAFPVMVAAAVWLGTGYAMIYLLAALQSVDRQLYEAAAIDGAGPARRFIDVTLPGIRGTLTFLALMGTIGALQLFELPYVLFAGNDPGNRTLTIVGYLYRQGFETGNLGYAAAIGWVLTLFIAAIALVQMRLVRQKLPGA